MGFYFGCLFLKVAIICHFYSTFYTPSAGGEHRGNAIPHPQACRAQVFQHLSQIKFILILTPVNVILSDLNIFKVSLLQKEKHRKRWNCTSSSLPLPLRYHHPEKTFLKWQFLKSSKADTITTVKSDFNETVNQRTSGPNSQTEKGHMLNSDNHWHYLYQGTNH